jgi:hypothetical protein
MRVDGYNDEEIRRWLWLRAIEWGAFPAFVSQPIVPVLFVFVPWYVVVLGVVALGIVWRFVRYSFVSVRVAALAVVPVAWLKWPAALCSCVWLFVHRQPIAGVLALLWPLVGGLVGAASGPAKVGIIELAFAKKIGYVSQDAEV